MTDAQMWTIIGTLGGLIVAATGWLHTLFSVKLESLRKEMEAGFERSELHLKLHEAEHHHK